MQGTTVAQKLNQGCPRRLGVLSGGCPFLVLFWANKKVQNKDENQILQETQIK
jgi:hypothetical protein